MGVWIFLDFCLLAAGLIALVLSIIWMSPNLLLNMVFTKSDLTAGLVLGVALIATFIVSIGAIVQRNHVTIGLVILNWVLILDALGVIVIGTVFWFATLMERNHFHEVYAQQTTQQRIAIQDKLKCCGYFNTSDLVEFAGNFCANQSFVQSPAFLGNDSTDSTLCVTPITEFADKSMLLTFTTVYAYMAVLVGLFLASLCVINKRLEDERFKRIDMKRGGRFI